MNIIHPDIIDTQDMLIHQFDNWYSLRPG